MDYLKRETARDYTAWDLNCPRVIEPDRKLRKKFRRKGRRKVKEEDEKSFKEILDNMMNE